ncbi:MAG TPA: penicillin-binding protein 2 [Mycobacteriales bacterium]|nr:penicillin-binding protein 2 [Mycobacteriales bacterium]
MNAPLRRVAVAVFVLFGLLIVNANYVQVLHADKLRSDPGNTRVLLSEYERQRGSIVVDGRAIARSVPTKDRLKYLRQYPNGPLYAPATGFYSLVYGAAGMERAENDILSGTDSRLLTRQLSDLFTGRDPRGGNVVLTLNAKAQQTAYRDMAKQTGAVVALDPRTGAILAMVSTPSYDPGTLSSHDAAKIRQSYTDLGNKSPDPMIDRAISARYPPGSVFKVVVAAAALEHGVKPGDRIPAQTNFVLPGTHTRLRNFDNETCGDGKTDTFLHALTISCNTAFAQLGITLGRDTLADEAQAFGIDDQGFTMPLRVAPSTVGAIPDRAALGQSAIGQRDVQITPMQGAMIASAVANGGVLMQPYLVKELQAPDLSTLDTTEPHEIGRAMPADVAGTLTSMMANVVNKGTGRSAQIDGVQVAGKTGTAENEKGAQPHAWFIGFAPADHPTVAVAVLLEHAGVAGDEVTGGKAAAPIARDVIQAVLASQGSGGR